MIKNDLNASMTKFLFESVRTYMYIRVNKKRHKIIVVKEIFLL